MIVGTEIQPYKNFIHAVVIVDGAYGFSDEIIVHDGSSNTRNQVVDANSLLLGIQFGINETKRTFFYKNAKVMNLKLGQLVSTTKTLAIRHSLVINYYQP